MMNAPVKKLELVGWCLLGALLIAGRLAVSGGPTLSNDGYQYLSVAANFLEGRLAETSLIHFDTERSWGTVPAPLTTFPSGFPLAISLLVRLGARAELAAPLLCVLATLCLLPLYYLAAQRLRLGGLATRFLFLWTILNAQVAQFANAITTEALFTALTFAGIVCFVLALQQRQNVKQQLFLLLTANALIGFSYWIRYAGLFFFAGSAVFVAFLWVRYRDRSWLRAAAGLGLSGAIISVGLIRNQRLVGTWKGGNTLMVHHSLAGVLSRFVACIHDVFLGERIKGFLAVELLFVAGVLAIVAFSLRARRKPMMSRARADVLWCLLLYSAIYSASMIYAATSSPISFDARMFYPLVPIALLAGAIWLSTVQEYDGAKGLLLSGLAISTFTYLVINLRHGLEPPSPAPHQLAEHELAGEMAPGISLRSWMQQNVGVDDAIVANRGQATGYVLKRGVISLISHDYSNQVWDERAVHELVERYRAPFLVVYLDDEPDVAVTRQSPLLTSVVRGQLPGWLTVAARNSDVLVLRAML